MKMRVSSLYRQGFWKSSNVYDVKDGDLTLDACKHPVTGRIAIVAMLLDSTGWRQLPDLHDAQCVVISATGFTLVGKQMVNGVEYAQEWFCAPADTATKI